MVALLLTVDYEVYGTGQGDPRVLMLEPTNRLIELANGFGAKLTIMAEAAEILAFRREDRFRRAALAIENQLRSAVKQGHDVQLHLHPAWFNSQYHDGHWQLDFGEYALVGLHPVRIREYLRAGRDYLQALLKPVRQDYRCIAFRAGNWLMQPCREVVAALEELGFLFDTSVFKHGWEIVGPYVLDYRQAHSELGMWVVAPEDINRAALREGLREVPILSFRVLFPSMVTFRRWRMHRRLRRGALAGATLKASRGLGAGRPVSRLGLFWAKKFDFCRLTFSEMRRFLDRAIASCKGTEPPVPVVAIGHSTEFTDDGHLRRFLEYVATLRAAEVQWSTFSGLCDSRI